jgi:hypothetical protein
MASMDSIILLLAWLNINISWSRRLGSIVASVTRRRHRITTNVVWAAPRSTMTRQHHHHTRTSLTSSPAWRFTTRLGGGGLEESYSNRQPDSGTLLPILLTSTRSERVITTMIWDTSSNQLSHFLSYILSRVNISIYFQLVNILL